MDSSVKIIVDQTFSATSFYECLYRVPLGGKDRVHKQRRFPFRYSRAGSSKTSFSLIPHASRLFMKQFLLNQTMDDADEGCLGGLVFHWYCIVNSRPKSHSDSQPAPSLPLSSFLLFLTSCTPLSLSFPSRIAALPLVSYREIIHEEEPRRTLAALGFHWTSFPLHLFANHLSRVRVLQYIYIFL